MKTVYERVAAVGLDVHAKFSTVTMRDAQGGVVRRERLEHRDRRQLREVLADWPHEVPMVLEASFGWCWLADEMLAKGLRPQLANCLKVEGMRRTRGWAKTNQKDADLLSLLPFEKDPWWRVWLSPPAVRDQREQLRYRAGLVQIQTQTKNRISALLQRHGIFHDFSDLFGVKGRKFLAQIASTGLAPEVSLLPGAREALASHLALLTHVREQLTGVALALRAQLRRTPEVILLDSISGIGLILAHTILSEIGRIERFRNHRALACYCQLAPVADDTGEEDTSEVPKGRRLGHRGNLTLKWAMIEAAHGAVKSGGRWKAMFDAATDGGRRNRGRGYIKVARALLAVVYAVLRDRVEYTDRPPARPGSGSVSHRKTRPGTGQPFRPMAAVRRGLQASK